MTDTKKNSAIGHRKPPATARFQKGQSGNPLGRPPGRHGDLPYDAVLGRMVTIHERGQTKRVTAAEAFLLQMAVQGVAGDVAANNLALAAEKRRSERAKAAKPISIRQVIVTPGTVNGALEPLGMAKKLDPLRETARMALEPWIVEAALKRLGDKRFTRDEQRTIVDATRMPWKVRWPRWWEVMP